MGGDIFPPRLPEAKIMLNLEDIILHEEKISNILEVSYSNLFLIFIFSAES